MVRCLVGCCLGFVAAGLGGEGVFAEGKPTGPAALLTDNVRPGQGTKTFPAGTKVLPTGAKYRWVRAGEFATDEESYKTGMRPNGTGKCCFDGHAGGWAETQTFSSWTGGVWATVEIDLQDIYLVTAADMWTLRRKDRDTEFAEIAVSRDGKTFVPAGRLEDKTTARTADAFIRVHGELERPAAVRYVRLRCRRRQTVPQQNIGEIALWGHPVPEGIRLLEAGTRPPVVFSAQVVGCGVANLDWSGFAAKAKGVKGWRIYRSDKPFQLATEAGVEALRRVDGKVKRLSLYPLQPERTYHLGVTAVYEDGECPEVAAVVCRMPGPVECATFGDMMAANHYWMGGGARTVQRPHEDAWEQVATELLGKTEMDQIRWWLASPSVVERMYEQGIALLTSSGEKTRQAGNALGCYLVSAGNEPDLSGRPVGEYVARLKRDYAGAKKANEANVVCAPTSGLSDSSLEWLDRFYATGVRDHFDVLDLHTYCKVSASYKPPPGYPKACPEVLFERMERVREIMAKHGDRDKPLISTEFGYTDCDVGNPAGPVTAEMKANYLVRGFVIHHVLGFRRVFLYSFRDEGDDPYYTEHHFGIVDYECQKKPAYHALKTLGDVLGKCVLAGPLDGCESPSYGYLYQSPDQSRQVAVVWNGVGETGGVFETKAKEVEVVGIYGDRRQVLVGEDGRFRVPYGPAPVYLCAAEPVRQVSQSPLATVRNRAEGLQVGVVQNRTVDEAEGSVPVSVQIRNPSGAQVRAVVRALLGKGQESRTVEIPPGEKVGVEMALPTPAEYVAAGEVVVGWEGEAASFSEKRGFHVRRLPTVAEGERTVRAVFAGCPEPVVLLSSRELDLAIDVARGCRILDVIDRRTGANQVHMDYTKLPGLAKVPFAYGIWFQAGKGLKNGPFRVVEAQDGRLVAEADSADGLRVRYAFALQGSEWSMGISMANPGGEPKRALFHAHPEYRVGGNGESDRDVVVLPIEGEVAKIPFWSGLGARSHAPLVAPWWQIDDTVAKVSLRQEWTPEAFGQPTIWFGEEFYNVEMYSAPDTAVAPGKSWEGRLVWRLVRP